MNIDVRFVKGIVRHAGKRSEGSKSALRMHLRVAHSEIFRKERA